MGLINCAVCKLEIERINPAQIYCRPCSAARDILRKSRWAKENPADPLTPEQLAVKREVRKARLKGMGAAISANQAQSITWCEDAGPDLLWTARVAFPFSWRLSKNAIWTTTRKGHVFMRSEAKSIREQLTMAIRSAMRDHKVANNKLWIDIFVQKPNHKGDAVNFVDVICDAIKKAIPLDDRWYSIRRLDWEIAKVNPKIYVGLGQDTYMDKQACSSCGRILPLADFNKQKSNKLGVARECRECRIRHAFTPDGKVR